MAHGNDIAATIPRKGMRTCVVCGAKLPKGRLMRVVRSPEGEVSVDEGGRAAGRGAYVCSAACLQKACASHRFDRALKTRLSKQDYERLAAWQDDAFHDMNR
ncbi:RNase P modulator RnpM [Curtanaerobium respiraculi]|jgi:predicted RNA-binding protein YlxR (DUF448 family)|uniref:RNase P modulator RnpM n=1 Tax=Curtanaerobium respiraculi TaxID=2949669 RepID=UPI0024B37E88|nr:YlxR family protein [Curtanaerobium respiraculi]